jgi:hypothetical protein
MYEDLARIVVYADIPKKDDYRNRICEHIAKIAEAGVYKFAFI